MDIVITNPRNAVSAVRLGLPVVQHLDNPGRYNNVINWGCSDGPIGPNVINNGPMVAVTVDKPGYLNTLHRADISCPEVIESGHLPVGKWVVRPHRHEEGNDFELIEIGDPREYYLMDDHHATKYIYPTREYRIWFAGEQYKTAKRIPRPSEGETDESCRSKWGYRSCDNFPGAIEIVKKARAVVPIQFGAFDLLWATEERKWYILEVNSAPSLDTESVRSFMTAGIKSLMRPEPVATQATSPRPPVTVANPSRRRIKVMTMEGWQEIEV